MSDDHTPLRQNREIQSGLAGSSQTSTADDLFAELDRAPRTPLVVPQSPSTPRSTTLVTSTPFSSSQSISSQRSIVSQRRGIIPSTPFDGYSPIVSRRGAGSQFTQDEDFAMDGQDIEDELLQMHQRRETLIWGTDLNVDECFRIIDAFVRNFSPTDDATESFYLERLRTCHENTYAHFELDCGHLFDYRPTRVLYHQLVQSPQEILPIFEQVVRQIFVELFGEEAISRRMISLKVHPFHLQESCSMRSIDPNHIEHLLAIQGMVIRCSGVVPELHTAHFRCSLCMHSMDVLVERGLIDEPSSCPSCQALGAMEMLHNRCLFVDKQVIRVQEIGQSLPQGETPLAMACLVYEDLVDIVKPGDRVEVTGLLRAVPGRGSNPRMRARNSVFRTYIDALHFLRTNQDEDPSLRYAHPLCRSDLVALARRQDGLNARAQALISFHQFAQGTPYESLVKAFAPSVWGLEDVKKGLLCLLLGGTVRRKGFLLRKKLLAAVTAKIQALSLTNGEDAMDSPTLTSDEAAALAEEEAAAWEEAASAEEETGGVHQRGDINILLCGDPGTSKSQLITYVHRMSGRGVLASGKGSSAAGLTAALARDPDTGESVLEAGALVLSDGGICCLDEFDKLSDQARGALHEALEQQSVSIAKAGLVASLHARTSLLACANPVESRYNPRRSVVDNVRLPPSLLSRFDLIFLVLDKHDSERDRRLAKHLVSLYFPPNDAETAASETEASTDQKFLKSFIAYAKENCFPDIGPDAEEELVNQYLALRSSGGNGKQTISATPRQLESLIRLSQALAKMRLAPFVLASDVREAARLVRVATQAAATDPRTGTIDMDLLNTGRAAVNRDLQAKLVESVRTLLLEKFQGQRVTVGQIRQQLLQNMGPAAQFNAHNESTISVSMAEVADAVRDLAQDGVIHYVERSQTVTVRGT